MEEIHLFHELLLRLPLQLVWRLIGFNHRLHWLMLDEFLWKRRCELEFPVLHENIPSYRKYWLKRTEKAYGRLWYNDVIVPEIERAQKVVRCADTYFVLTAEGGLYSGWYRPFRPCNTGVIRLIETNRNDQKFYTVQRNRIIATHNDGRDNCDSYYVIDDYDCTAIIDLIEFNSKIIYLTNSGQVYLWYKNQTSRELFPGRRYIDLLSNFGETVLHFSLLSPTSVLEEYQLIEPNDKVEPNVRYKNTKYDDIVKYYHGGITTFAGLNRRKYSSTTTAVINIDGTGSCNIPFLESGRFCYRGIIDLFIENSFSIFVAQSKV